MQRTRKVIARLLAVLAVLAAFVAIYIVVSNSSSDDGGLKATKNSPAKHDGKDQKKKGSGKAGGETASGKRFYEIQDGDTLIKIAAKTGLTVGELETLNPAIDPQILSVGEKLKLR